MRVSLEQKIEYLARTSNFKIKKNYWEVILLIFDWDEIENSFKSKSVSRVITQAYKYVSIKCTCKENMACSFCNLKK